MVVVAVVDDEEQVRRSMSRLLRAAGYEPALFAGGAQFIDSLQGTAPACVLVDGNMPGMDGRELLSRLSRLPVRVPAIVVSGHDSPEHRRAAAEAGAAGFFTKPFNPEALLAAVAAAIKQ
jgi:two-component system, LuxR family, response regulator FixJ